MSADESPEPTETAAPRPGAVPRYRLVPVSAAGGSPRFAPRLLSPGITYIGRVPSCDVIVESELVSRRHAKLILTDMGVTVHDLDSHNGVFIAGKKVRSAPVTAGQLLYFADVCCTLEPAGEGEFDLDSSLNRSHLVSAAMGTHEDDSPAVNNLATLYRATDLLLQADDDTFFIEVVSLCQALTEAHLAVLVVQEESGALSTPVMLREGTGPKDDTPIGWTVVRKALDDRVTLFSRDAENDPLVPGDVLSSGERGAVMCVPILSEARALGALYFARPKAGQGFADRELETLSAVAHLVAVRLAGNHRLVEETSFQQDTAEERAQDDRSQVELADLRERVAGLERELEAHRIDTAARAGDQERLAAEVERRREESEAARADAERLKAELESLQAQVERSRAEGEALRSERAAREDAEGRERQAAATAQQELLTTRAEIAALKEQLVAQRHATEAARAELEAAQAELEAARAEAHKASEADALHAAAAQMLPSRVQRRLTSLASGAPAEDVAAGPATVLCTSLSGLDAWAQSASPQDLKARLDWFLARVKDIAAHAGGEVEQVLGHTVLVRFMGDAPGVAGAVRCALDVVGEALSTGASAQAGIHLGADVSGLFGPSGTLAHVGEAPSVSRGAAEFAQPGTVYVSEAVRGALGAESGLMMVALGPHIIRGLPSPVNLYQLVAQSGEAS